MSTRTISVLLTIVKKIKILSFSGRGYVSLWYFGYKAILMAYLIPFYIWHQYKSISVVYKGAQYKHWIYLTHLGYTLFILRFVLDFSLVTARYLHFHGYNLFCGGDVKTVDYFTSICKCSLV